MFHKTQSRQSKNGSTSESANNELYWCQLFKAKADSFFRLGPNENFFKSEFTFSITYLQIKLWTRLKLSDEVEFENGIINSTVYNHNGSPLKGKNVGGELVPTFPIFLR